jgi:Protein of unknown function (DUF2474)
LSDAPPSPLYKRLLWMLGIWSMSVLALGAVAGLIRLAIKH